VVIWKAVIIYSLPDKAQAPAKRFVSSLAFTQDVLCLQSAQFRRMIAASYVNPIAS
jgi:hypothetical protein